MPDLSLENRLWAEGYRVVGCDEAGRGAWSGPLFVGAVTLREGDIPFVQSLLEHNESWRQTGCVLRDSKKMTERQRYAVYRKMMEEGVPYAVGDATTEEIDKHGIEAAFSLALHRAGDMLMMLEKQTSRSPSEIYQKTAILIDGARYRNLRLADTSLSGAEKYEVVAEDKLDDASATVALASIVAKVHQSITMVGMNLVFPEYGLGKSKGYPTAAHREAVAKHGLSVIHRVTWEVK